MHSMDFSRIKMRFEHWLLAFFALATVLMAVTVSTPAHGASGQSSTPSTPPNQQGYRLDQQTAAFRSGLNAADSTNLSTCLATTEFVLLGSRNIPVSARFSAASQTCKVRILYVYKPSANNILGISEEITLTGTALTDAGGLYTAPTTVFDGMGASHARILLTSAPASGTVDLWAGSF